MLLSIIVPIYNKQNYIKNLVKNLKQQTSKNFEVLFINDGSTDESLYRLKLELKKVEFKFKIINKKNEGVSETRNLGIKESKGKYVYFLDADDMIAVDLTDRLEKNCPKEDIILFGYNSYERKGNQINKVALYTDNYVYSESKDPIEILNKFINREIWIHICSGFYLREFLNNKNLLFKKNLLYGEDRLFIKLALLNAKSINTIPKEMYTYIKTQNSAMTTFSFRKFDSIKALNLLYNKFHDNKFYNKLLIEEINNFLKEYHIHRSLKKQENLYIINKIKVIVNKNNLLQKVSYLNKIKYFILINKIPFVKIIYLLYKKIK